jgi:hypothetical protein
LAATLCAPQQAACNVQVEFSPLPLMPAENHETVQDRIMAAPVGKIVKGILSRSRSALRLRDQLAARRGCR